MRRKALRSSSAGNNMTYELRLVEDAPIAGQEFNYDAVVPRGIYIATGEIASGGSSYAEDDGFLSPRTL